MKRDIEKPIYSSFLSCEKDAEEILYRLFVKYPAIGNKLKRLLVINTKNCLDDDKYEKDIKDISFANLVEHGYIKLEPKIRFPEHEEIKSYIILSFDNFTPNATNPQFRDCTINFDILCHTDYWNIGDYRIRPLKIIGYIDGILNECKLSGIGTLNFLGCNQMILDENLSGYTLSYRAIHGKDDSVPLPQYTS